MATFHAVIYATTVSRADIEIEAENIEQAKARAAQLQLEDIQNCSDWEDASDGEMNDLHVSRVVSDDYDDELPVDALVIKPGEAHYNALFVAANAAIKRDDIPDDIKAQLTAALGR